jgi:phage terminase large subunit GpA-like protein
MTDGNPTTPPKAEVVSAFERGRQAFRRERAVVFMAKSRLTVPDWADTFRHLSKSVGSTGGPWTTARVEIGRGPMMAVTERGVRTITAKTCTQLLKTSLLENTIGYFSHQDPSPMLLTQPKADSVKAFSKERLQPMAKATPVLRKILGGDNADDTQTYRSFPGGFLAMESAGSPTNLAMRAIRVTLADEIDKYEPTKEGDPLILLEERTATFVTNSLHLRCCSPTRADTSRITKSYEESDQRRAYVACPHCKHEQVLDFFKHVNWSKGEDGQHFPFTAAIYCEDCGAEWSEAQRLKLMTTKNSIIWRQTKPFVCCEPETQKPLVERRWRWDDTNQVGYALCKHCGKQAVPNTHAGFTASKLYSPFTTIPELAEKWLLSKDDPETKQTFYNTQLGLEFHQETVKSLEKHALAERAEVYAADIPRGGLVLTMGVDVQSSGRLEGEVVAWGKGEESWSIDTPVFIGDPAQPEVWKELDAYLHKRFKLEGGGEMVIKACCIDSGGHNTEEVYKFCRPRITRNVWAIKGANDRPGQKSPLWPIPKLDRKKVRNTGYRPVIIGTGSAKEAIYQRLALETPGPGYCHFPTPRMIERDGVIGTLYNEAWFEQLTSEKQIAEKKHGFSYTRWILPKGRANEALDCRVYAYAALSGLYAVRKLSLDKIAAIVEAAHATAVSDNPIGETAVRLMEALKDPVAALEAAERKRIADAQPPPPPPPRPARRVVVRRSRWMG